MEIAAVTIDEDTPTEELIRRLREIGEHQNDADAAYIALLWPAFGLDRHLRSEAAWRGCALWWEDYAYVSRNGYDRPTKRDRWQRLGAVLRLHNDFYRTEMFHGIDEAAWRAVSDKAGADMMNARISAGDAPDGLSPAPVDPRWVDDNEDDDDWTLYLESCAAMGFTRRADWPALDQTLRRLLDRPDCYNDVSRTRFLVDDIIHRARRVEPVPSFMDGQHRGTALRSLMKH
jgi:hypothetical protein